MSYDSGNSSNKMITHFGLNEYSSHSAHQEKLEKWLQQEISEVYLHEISQEEVVEILWKKISTSLAINFYRDCARLT